MYGGPPQCDPSYDKHSSSRQDGSLDYFGRARQRVTEENYFSNEELSTDLSVVEDYLDMQNITRIVLRDTHPQRIFGTIRRKYEDDKTSVLQFILQ